MYGEAKIYLSKVIAVDGAKVKVQYGHTKSDFVPYLQTSNSFKRHFTPPQIDEVVVFFKFLRSGFVIGSILPPSQIPSEENQESITYADGTSITYKDGILEIDSLRELIIKCSNATIEADSIILGKNVNSLSGVVTGECVCPFTGSPHADFSNKVKVAK